MLYSILLWNIYMFYNLFLLLYYEFIIIIIIIILNGIKIYIL